MANTTSAKWRSVVLWVASILLAAVFLMVGGSKLAGVQQMVDNFARWGYPEWFIVVIGVVEVTGAVALLIPAIAGLGALVLGGVMVGALVTHLINGEFANAIVPVVLGLVLIGILWARKARLTALLGRLGLPGGKVA